MRSSMGVRIWCTCGDWGRAGRLHETQPLETNSTQPSDTATAPSAAVDNVA